jgi:hypothetical protein
MTMSSAFNTKHAKLHFPSDAISDRRRRKKKARHRTAPESLIGRHRQVERCEGELEVMHRDGHLVSDRGIETPNAFQKHANLWMATWEVAAGGNEEMPDPGQCGRDGCTPYGTTGSVTFSKTQQNEISDELDLGRE